MQNNKTTNEFRTLAKIRERKEELLEEIQKDTEKVTALWNDTFVNLKSNTMKNTRCKGTTFFDFTKKYPQISPLN